MSDERYSVREERRSRKQLSCAECHRLKLKCDRQVPCCNCVRRECAELCPNSVRVKKAPQSEDSSSVVLEMRERLTAIEGLLSRLGDERLRSRSHSRSPRRDRDRNRDRDHERERSRDIGGYADSTRDQRRERERQPRRRRDSDDGDRQSASPFRSRSRSRSPWFDPHDRDRGGRAEERHIHERDEHVREARRRKGKEVEYPPQLSPPGQASTSRSVGHFAAPDTRPAHMASRPGSLLQRDTRAPWSPPQVNARQEGRRERSREGHRHADSFSFRYDSSHYSTPTANEESYGTLVIDQSGRSKWLGPTAGTEWLKNQEMSDAGSPRRSASPSPPSPNAPGWGAESHFPFVSWGPAPTMETIEFHLPPPEDAATLLDAYYRNYTWNHDVAPRQYVQPLFDRVYDKVAPEPLARRVHPQQLALLFIIMAMGVLHNPVLPPHDPRAEHHLAATRWCLVKGDFIGHNTIAGLQAVVIMAHYHLETEKGRNGDSAWPLWGLAMRLVTAMGLHRDGARWNLPPDVVEERRHVFWECHTIDVFQANCFSRPSSLRPEHIDTEFPLQSSSDSPKGQKSFRTLKFELCRISGAVLDQAMDVRPTPYTAITLLYDRLCAFERHIPFYLRCRTALLALPSVYADVESATRDSPDVTRGDLQLTFQQFTLALNVSECILFLQRPYFVKALQEAPQDPTRSVYGKSYLAVVERCNVLIEVVAGLHELYPTVTARHWFFWYHLFTAAVCIGTMIIKNSSNPLAGFALGQIDHAINLYSAVLRDHPTPSLVQNHQWLLRLRQRALSRVEQERASANGTGNQQQQHSQDDDGDIDVELLGWRTRLVERARHGPRPRPVSSSAASQTPVPAVHATAPFGGHPGPGPSSAPSFPALSPPIAALAPTAPIEQVLQQHFAAPPGPSPQGVAGVGNTELSTDLFLHQFWDPTMLLEARNVPHLASANWWDFDTQLATLDANIMGSMTPHS